MWKFEIKEDTFKTFLLVIIGSEEDYCNFVNKTYKEEIKPDFTTKGEFRRMDDTKDNGDKTKNIIYLERYNGSIEDQGILVHEIFHYVIHEMERRQIYLVYKDNGCIYDEQFAYFYEKIFKEIMKKLKSKKTNQTEQSKL